MQEIHKESKEDISDTITNSQDPSLHPASLHLFRMTACSAHEYWWQSTI